MEQIPSADAVEPIVSRPVVGRSARDLRDSTPPEPDWLVPGILGLGMTTELNGREKIGKGWFEAYLLGNLERGVPTLFGPGNIVEPATALIYTEEPEVSLREKLQAFDLERAFLIYHWELAIMGWPQKIDMLIRATLEKNAKVLFIDNISSATGVDDENGVALARSVEPLAQKAKEHGIAVLYDRHQRKSGGQVEDVSRGGTALAGAVDQIVAMFKGNERERKLTSWGRLWGHNWKRTVELTEAHDDYVDLGLGDWKEERLLEADEWTIAEFQEAAGVSYEGARQFLDGSELVMRRKERRGKQYVYDVIKNTPPALD
jgi:hypothetical protein